MANMGRAPRWLLAYGNWLFRHRNKVFPVVLLALFGGLRPRLAGGSFQADFWLDLLGLGLAAAGQALRGAVIGYAYIKRGGINKRFHAERLVEEGFFAHSRNPLYVGNLLILGGLFLVHNHPLVYLIGGLYFFTAYLAIVAAEEVFLGQRFGEAYARYCARVPRWLPRLGGLRGTLSGMDFNWRRVVLKDYASCYAWLMTALALLVYEAIANAPHGGYGQRIAAVAGLGVALTVAFLAVRALKKGRVLTELP